MQTIAQWLEKLGMSEYAARFAENRVDFAVLRDLSDQDLKDLGVVLGDRRKLLRAIGDLEAVRPAEFADTAERRQLTLMFCDLVGSTALSARLDPEDLREIIGGYPRAHEHDAERAVQAGLALAEAVPKLVTVAGVPLQVRIGIATGLVVVGDLIESGESQERGVVGETPNLAARLQAIAEPGAVVIAEGTRRLLGNFFELQDTADFTEGRAHLDRAIALYNPAAHRLLATRFGHDVCVSALAWRAFALWALGDTEAARADIGQALEDAREIDHAATSMYALSHTSLTLIHGGHHAQASALIDELVVLADAKGTLFWKAYGMLLRGWLLMLDGKAMDAVELLTSAITAMRSTGATGYAPWYLSTLAQAHAQLGQFEDAWRCVGEATTAVERTQEKWCEADIHRIAGEIALRMPQPDLAKAEASFVQALSTARRQQAKSFEQGAAKSLARLWRDQGKQREAETLL